MPWLGTSWKMTKSLAEARVWVEAVGGAEVPDGVTPFVLPPHTALAAVAGAVPAGHALRVGAQDAHWSADPEWTGEVSVAQVADAGASLVEVGHSERRRGLGEGDGTVRRKLRAVLDAGLTPLLCVGEDAAARTSGASLSVVADQVASALDGVGGAAARVLLAYEPVWSIGVRGRPASPVDVRPVVEHLRRTVEERCRTAPLGVLYGGSVTTANAAALLRTGCDGLFVGRAAWEPAGFLALLDVVAGARDAVSGERSVPPRP